MDEKPKRKTKTSSAVKDRYNAKVYSTVQAHLPKALVAEFKQACIDRGISQASVIQAAIEEFLRGEQK